MLYFHLLRKGVHNVQALVNYFPLQKREDEKSLQDMHFPWHMYLFMQTGKDHSRAEMLN